MRKAGFFFSILKEKWLPKIQLYLTLKSDGIIDVGQFSISREVFNQKAEMNTEIYLT